MPVWLVSGASGFLGRALLEAASGPEVPPVELLATGRRCPREWPASRFVEADLTDPSGVASVVQAASPDLVFHLAGKTPPSPPGEMYQANTLGTALLLDAMGRLGRPARVVLAGSAAELGPVASEDLPVDEFYPCRPLGEYGLSKYLATVAGLSARPPLEVVVGRIFNLVGPGTPEIQALGQFAARLAEGATRLSVGDLETRRDFLDVRDAARALIALALRGTPGQVYHVGRGHSWRVGDGLAELLRLAGRPVALESDPDALAKPGPRDSRADIGRIVAETGWRPAISWEQSLNDLWNEVRTRPRLPLTG